MSVSRTYTCKDLGKYLRNLQKNLVPAAVRGIHSGAARGVTVVQEAVTKAPPASPNGSVGAFNTGQYRAAWRWSKLPGGGATIFNGKKYAGIIEDGRRAGAKPPPRAVIAKWAQRKLGLTRKQAEAAAFPIARAIAKRGLRPRRVVASVASKLEAIVMTEVMHEVDLVIKGGKP